MSVYGPESLNDIAVGQTYNLSTCRWLEGVPPVLQNYVTVYGGTVTRNLQNELEWTADVSFIFSSSYRRRGAKARGQQCLELARTLRECREQGVRVSSIACQTHSSSRIKWAWYSDHQSVVGETARMVRTSSELQPIRLRDLIYVIGPKGEFQPELLDIWVVRKVGVDSLTVSSLVEPSQFKMVEVKLIDLQELLPLVVVSGLPFRGLVSPAGKTLGLDKTFTQCDTKGNVSGSALRPPVISGIRVT
jgi:hypothetical protein